VNVLVVVAHPDDEVLGCGGTIRKLSDSGDDVSVMLATRRCDRRGRENWSALVEAFEESCALLGAKAVLGNALLDETQAEARVDQLHDAILPLVERANLVLTHWPGDVNQVHRGVARAVEIATRPFRRRRNVSCFEIPTSTDQVFGGTTIAFQPTEYVLLTAAQVERKRTALAFYSTEMAPGRTPDDVERRMRFRGAEIGAEFAEAFVVARRFQ
jgi:LmbE family N-acetylglucosaminyl deacetylase